MNGCCCLDLVILPDMFIQEVEFETIDLEDEVFRISEGLDLPAVQDSLREIGQLNPVLLWRRGSRHKIVCGFRRIRALRGLSKSKILARILQADEYSAVQAYSIAVRDNLSHRQLNPLENARILHKLHNEFGLPDTTIIREYLPLLGLSPAEHVFRSYLLLHQIHPGLRQCLADGRLTLSSIESLAGKSPSVQNSFAVLMGKIRLSASLQKKLLALLDDLAGVGGDSPRGALDREDVIEITGDQRLSPFQKGERVFELIYRLRNPRLSLAQEQFQEKKKRLGLTGSIRVSAHPFFEEPGLRVEFDAINAARFRELVAALQESADSPEFEDLFNIS